MKTNSSPGRHSGKRTPPDKFKRGIAYLVSLTEQIKRHSNTRLNKMLELETVEWLLEMPELTDRDWTQESPEHQSKFLQFLEICISTYKKTLKQIEIKESQTK